MIFVVLLILVVLLVRAPSARVPLISGHQLLHLVFCGETSSSFGGLAWPTERVLEVAQPLVSVKKRRKKNRREHEEEEQEDVVC